MKHQPSKAEGSNWVQYMIRVTHWDGSHTTNLEEFSLVTVHSLLIDNDPEFRELKAVIDNYNASLRDAMRSKQPVNHASFRSKFTASLYKMLCEVCQMKNSYTQKKCLSEVYRWARDYEFEKKYRPVTATTRASRPNTAATRPFSGVSIVVPTGANAARLRYGGGTATQLYELNREINYTDYEPLFDGKNSRNSLSKNDNKLKGNSETIAYSADFREKSRTVHMDLEAPQKRLANYKRKCLDLQPYPSLGIPKVKKYTKAVIVKPKVEVKKEPVVEVKYPEPAPVEPQQPPLAEGEQPPPAEGTGEQAVAEEEDIPGLGGYDEIALYGEGEEEAEAEPEEVLDKLAPRTKPYIQDYVAIEHDALLAEQRRALSNRNKVVDELREEQEMVRVGEQWARSKSRWYMEENRRRESSKVEIRKQRNQSAKVRSTVHDGVVDLSQPANLFLTDKLPVNSLFRYEETINRTHLDTMKATNLQNIGYLHSRDYEVVPPAFDANSAHLLKTRALSAQTTSQLDQPKKFTDILAAAQAKVQSELDLYIIEIKYRLAKNKVPCKFDRLQSALSYEQPTTPPEGVMFITGRQLPSNPHFKVAKKKKKKK